MPIHDGLEHSAADDAMRRRIIAAGAKASTVAEVARTIGAAFVLQRRVVTKETKKRLKKVEHVTPVTVDEAITAVLKLYAPSWVATLTPALVAGYSLGLREAKSGDLSEVWIRETAATYAASLGDHLDEVSKEALLSGFQTQVNRRVAARAAAERVIDAFGVTPRTMKALVNIWLKAPDPAATVLTSREVKNPITERIDKVIASSLLKRMEQIGDTEAHSAKAQAKQLAWLWGLQTGEIPSVARKVWLTALDERVCPQCGPLDGKDAPIDEKFKVPGGGRVWGPALHPDCRCDLKLEMNPAQLRNVMIELTIPERELVGKSAWGVVHKARGSDPYDRDRDGRFATRESRPARQYREATREEVEQAEQVANLLRNVEPEADPTKIDLSGPSLGAINLGAINLKPISLDSAKISLQDRQGNLPQIGLSQSRLSGIKNIALSRDLPPIALKDDPPESEFWVASGKPLFGVFGPKYYASGYDEGASDLMLAGIDTPFFRDEDPKSGYSPIKEALAEYWNNFMENQADDLFTDGGWEYDSATSSIFIDYNDRRVRVPYEAFIDSMTSALFGRTAMSSDDVEIYEVRRYANDEDYDEREYLAPSDSSAGPNERAMLINAHELAMQLNLPSYIEEYVPEVGIAQVINATHSDDDSTRTYMTNPGKWRILYPSSMYNGDPDNEYLPANYYVIEPEDMFDNAIPDEDDYYH